MDQKTVTILLGLCIIIVLFYLYNRQKEPLEGDEIDEDYEHLEETDEPLDEQVEELDEDNQDEQFEEQESFIEGMAPVDAIDQLPTDAQLAQKMIGKNTNVAPKPEVFNYADGKRGNANTGEWDAYFNQYNEPVSLNYIKTNDKFVPVDSASGNQAAYVGKNTKIDNPYDMFKVDELLPQEMKKDWFEVMPDAIKVKNRHLINVTKPIGVNTIGSSLRNPSYDIRGTPSCPKFVVSPWMQSSIEPDVNIKCLC